MSTAEQQAAQAAAATTEAQAPSLLEQAIKHTRTERDWAKQMIGTLVEEVTRGIVKIDKDMIRSIQRGIDQIDQVVSKQLAEIMHHPAFQQLEGTWRGLHYLVDRSETGEMLKIKVFNCDKRTLFKDLEKAPEFDQSALFKKMYEHEFGMPGGKPYGALIGDYQFSNHPDDIMLLEKMAQISAAAFCPFISAPAPQLFGFESWTEMTRPRDLAKIFESKEHIKWRAFRDSEDSRFVVLTMPRTLARLPYGKATKPIDEFNFEEVQLSETGEKIVIPHDQYCWMNTAFVMGARLTDAFAKTGWCTAIRGAENGGKVEGLPAHVVRTMDGDLDLKCPTEIGIPDRREAELSKLGFLPLCHYKDTDYSVFFGAQTTQKPKNYGPRNTQSTENAAISARLPYMMACSRIAHYLKVIARDKVGSFMERSDCEEWLNRWIMNYVTADPKPGPEQKARYPLAEAKIEVKEIPGQPGAYNASVKMRPWLQMEELNAALSMVTKIDSGKK